MKTLLAALLVSFVLRAPAFCSERDVAEVYYIPFWVETYIPMIHANIRQYAFYKYHLSDKNDVTSLLRIMSSDATAPSRVDQKRIRLLLIMLDGKHELLVDAGGNVYDGQRSYKLSSESLKKLDALAKSLSGTTGPVEPAR